MLKLKQSETAGPPRGKRLSAVGRWTMSLLLLLACLFGHQEHAHAVLARFDLEKSTLSNDSISNVFCVRIMDYDGNNDGWKGDLTITIDDVDMFKVSDYWPEFKNTYNNEDYWKKEVKGVIAKGSFSNGNYKGSVSFYNKHKRSGTSCIEVYMEIVLENNVFKYNAKNSKHKVALKGTWMEYQTAYSYPRGANDTNRGFVYAFNYGSMPFPTVSQDNIKRTGSKEALFNVSLDKATFKNSDGSYIDWRYGFRFTSSTTSAQEAEPSDCFSLLSYYDNLNTTPVALTNTKYRAVTKGAQAANLKMELTSNYRPIDVYVEVDKFLENYKTTYNSGSKASFYKWYEVIKLNGYPKASSVTGTFDPWTKKISLKWTKSIYNTSRVNEDGKWVIFRSATEGGKLTKVKVLDYDEMSYQDSFTDLKYNNTYYYYVVFQPNEWKQEFTTYEDAIDLYAKVRVSSARSELPDVLTNISAEENTNMDGIIVSWTFPGFKDASSSKKYSIKLYRKLASDDYWDNTALYTQDITSSTTSGGSYEDKKASSRTKYLYRIEVDAQDSTYSQKTDVGVSITNGTKVTKMTASRGNFSGSVRINWDVQHIGNNVAYYVVYRRLLGSKSAWQQIYTTSGVVATYSYEDNSTTPGNYYEYMVECYELDSTGARLDNNVATADGFALATGIINGRIAYGSGTAVKDVKVALTPVNGSTTSAFRSVKIAHPGTQAGIKWQSTAEEVKSLLEKDFTIQMYVCPDSTEIGKQGTAYNLFDTYNTAAILLYKLASGYRPVVEFRTADKNTVKNYHFKNVVIPASKWANLAVTLKDNKLSCIAFYYDDNGDLVELNDSYTLDYERAFHEDAACMVLGNYQSIGKDDQGNMVGGNTNSYAGNIDDFRLFTKALEQSELKNNFDHRLSGSEEGLAIYYPFDEGINEQLIAYDYSKTGGLPNGRHANIYIATIDTKVPSATEFSISGRTDANGNYTISGIPFSGDGTSYTISPSLGIHKFTPTESNRFVSAQSLVHNGVDFEDVSSFPVSGTVYYENTDYPLVGANLYVDGNICSRNGSMIKTDDNGEFTIDVPIGDHYIEIRKTDHTFVNGGRYPADPENVGTKFTFDREVTNLTFFDNTKVIICGRVTGGDIENSKIMTADVSADSLLYLRSKNNIGKAQITLKADHRMNVVRNATHPTVFDNNTASVEYPSPSSLVCSKTFVGGGTENNTKTITITTDPETGEWAALVPPIKYHVEACKVINNAEAVISMEENLELDASNASRQERDSINLSGDNMNPRYVYGAYKYVAALKQPYYSKTVFEITDSANVGTSAFGEKVYTNNEGDKAVKLPLYTEEGGNVTYPYGYPVFIQGKRYVFDVFGYELYTNYDDEEPVVDKMPLSGMKLTFENQFSDKTVVAIQDGTNTETGETVKDGDIVAVSSDEIVLDSLGRGSYRFKTGLPNITAPYTLGLNMTYALDGEETPRSWDQNGKFKVIVFGSLPTGNNFITAGPDKVSMILRDPPGTNSYAYWEKGTSIESSYSHHATVTSENKVGVTINFGTKITNTFGLITAAVITEENAVDKLSLNFTANYEGEYGTDFVESSSTTQRIETSDEPSLVGWPGDLFIGQSQNYVFGKTRDIGPHITDGGTYELNLKDKMSVSTSFKTDFIYPQSYIETTLIPNIREMRNNFIQKKGAAPKAFPKYYGYQSLVSDKDEHFGEEGYYELIKPTNTKDEFIVCDSVEWCNEQIRLWVDKLRQNEEAKVKVINESKKYFKRNVSFTSGSNLSYEDARSFSDGWTAESSLQLGVFVANTKGFQFNETGCTFDVEFNEALGYRNSSQSSTTNSVMFGYVLKEDGDDDALSVDIYDAPDGFGPIFVTRAGQTTNPYEGEAKTQYLEGEQQIISYATMQIEKPKLRVEENTKTGIPSGTAGLFTLLLTNESETNHDCEYLIQLCSESNPDGAVLTINGRNIADDDYSVIVRAGETLKQTLHFTQSDEAVRDYRDIKVRLASVYQNDDIHGYPCIADTVSLNAFFVPSCSDIQLALSRPVLNTETDTCVVLSVDKFDKNHSSLKEVQLLYRKVGDPKATILRQYVVKESAVDQTHFLLPDGKFSYILDMRDGAFYPDGEYQFMARTVCDDDVTCETDPITLVKDVELPQLIAQPSPTNGILTADGEISVLFNENIRSGELTKSNNFIVSGKLNDAQVAHDGVLSLQGTEPAKTESVIDLSNRNFALNLWMKYTAEGTIFSHGATGNKLVASVDAQGHLVVDMAGQKYTSTKTIPSGKWNFLMLTVNNEDNTLSARAAHDDETVNLFADLSVPAYTGNGQLAVGGNGYSGSIHEVTLWNTNRSLDEAQSQMYTSKSPSTADLIGYWRLDEGHGAVGTDYVRNRHMKLPSANGWYMANKNYAVALSGSEMLGLDVSAAITGKNDNYMLEAWVKADKTQSNPVASVMQFGGDALDLHINNGVLELVTKASGAAAPTTTIIGKQLGDGEWHHVALNVRKATSGSAILYIDGKQVKQISAALVPGISTDRIFIGGRRTIVNKTDRVYDQMLKGAVDEVRYWKGNISSDLITANMYQRIDGQNPALAAYYPFEKMEYDQYNQQTWNASLYDAALEAQVRPDAQLFGASQGAATAQFTSTETPALKAAPEVEALNYSFVADERKILINLNADAARIEGTTLQFTLRNIHDMQNNAAEDITWTAYIQRNQLKWAETEVEVTKQGANAAEFAVEFNNQSGTTESWVISNLPSWITADVESGTLLPLANRTVHFKVDAGTAIGSHEAVIYLTGSLGINAPLVVNVTSVGEVPEWSVNASDYEYTMNVNGQLSVNGTISQDKSDIVAAFRGDECVGVAHPSYYSRYDAYYVLMTIYGNGDDDGEALTYKVYDASTGKICPMVVSSIDKANTFLADGYVGSMSTPNLWTSSDKIEQNIELKKGWQWISFSVTPDHPKTKDLMTDIKSKANKMINENATWTPLVSNLSEVRVGAMYKLQMADAATLKVIGTPVSLSESPVSIKNGWNWLGYSGNGYVSLNDAFAELQPEEEDIIKSNNQFATWNTYEWVGTLQALQSGVGYLYLSNSQADRQFHYPTTTATNNAKGRRAAAIPDADAERQDEIASLYSGNMNVILNVSRGGVAQKAKVRILDAEGNLRGVSDDEDYEGLHFLTVSGNVNGDALYFIVETEGLDYVIPGTLIYSDDIVVGSLKQPLTIDLDSPTGIGTISADAEDNAVKYDLQGRPVGRTVNKQIIIRDGKKIRL